MNAFVVNGLWWIGILISLTSIPMTGITYKNGKAIYKFYKEEFSRKMEMYHSTYILKDRNVTDERTLFGFSKVINSRWKNMQLELYDKKKHVNKKIVFNRYLSRFINLSFVMIIIVIMTSSVFSNYFLQNNGGRTLYICWQKRSWKKYYCKTSDWTL